MKRLIINICITLVTIMLVVLLWELKDKYEIVEYILNNNLIMYGGILIIVFIICYSIKWYKRKKEYEYTTKVNIENESNEFKDLYKTLCTECKMSFEVLRKKVLIREIAQYILSFMFLIGYAFSESKQVLIDSDTDFIISIIGLSFGFLVFPLIYFNMKYKKKYVKEYKQKVISQFVKLVDKNLTYNEQKDYCLAMKEYEKANFDEKEYTNFLVTDEITGSLEGKYNINLWDLDIQKVTGSGKYRSEEQIFKGIFTVTECSNNIEGRIKICKNKRLTSEEKVNLDSKEFEKYFDVYSSDPILALRVLTHDIMEMLIEFHNKYKLDFEIILENNKVYIKFATVDMFEPKVFGSSIERKLLYTEYVILQFIIELTKNVNEVQLNIQ